MSSSTHSAAVALRNFKRKYHRQKWSGIHALYVYIATEKVPRHVTDFSGRVMGKFVTHMVHSATVPEVPTDLTDEVAADYILSHLRDFVRLVVNAYLEIERQETGVGPFVTEVDKPANHAHIDS